MPEALGAAILAGVGVGVWNTIEEAVTATVRTDRVFEPQARVHEIYVDHHHYKSTYNAPVPRFAAMATSRHPPKIPSRSRTPNICFRCVVA